MIFNKKVTKTMALVKVLDLTDKGWEISYHIEVDGRYVSNSASKSEAVAKKFFQVLIENRGIHKISEVIIQEQI